MTDTWEDALAEATALGAGVRMDVYALRTQFVTDPSVAVGQVDMNVIKVQEPSASTAREDLVRELNDLARAGGRGFVAIPMHRRLAKAARAFLDEHSDDPYPYVDAAGVRWAAEGGVCWPETGPDAGQTHEWNHALRYDPREKA